MLIASCKPFQIMLILKSHLVFLSLKFAKKNHAVHICLKVGRRSNLLLNFRFKERGRYWAELLCSLTCFSRLLHVFSFFLNFYKIPISLNNVFALKISQAILHTNKFKLLFSKTHIKHSFVDWKTPEAN